jgi:hypothetical protein
VGERLPAKTRVKSAGEIFSKQISGYKKKDAVFSCKDDWSSVDYYRKKNRLVNIAAATSSKSLAS